MRLWIGNAGRSFAVLLLVLHVGACVNPDGTSESFVVRDSAGIRIVESKEPVLPLGSWTVSNEPVLDIGGDDSDEMQNLHRVAAAAVLSDGRVVVAHSPAPMVRWFAADGAYLTGAGRPSGGPGEFGGGEDAWIYTMWPIEGDSIATWEHSARRMQVFDPAGRYARSVFIELPKERPLRTYPQIAGRSRTGFVAFLAPSWGLGPLGEKKRDDFIYLAYGADGSFQRRLARLPGFEAFTMEMRIPGQSEPFRAEGRPPFSKPVSSWVHEDRFFYGSADRYEIAVYDFEGRLTELIRKNVPNQPVTPDIVAAYKKQRLAAAASSPAPSARTVPGLDDLPYPDSLPAYRRLRVDREGWLWVQTYDLPGDTTVIWSVFDRSRRWITDVGLPKAWQVYDVGADYILAVVKDDFDVEHVAKFSLLRRE